MDLSYLIDYCEEHRVITLVEADELRNDVDVLESKESDLINAELRIEQLEDKLLETIDVVFKLRRENETLKKHMKRWANLLTEDGHNTKKEVYIEIIKDLNLYE